MDTTEVRVKLSREIVRAVSEACRDGYDGFIDVHTRRTSAGVEVYLSRTARGAPPPENTLARFALPHTLPNVVQREPWTA